MKTSCGGTVEPTANVIVELTVVAVTPLIVSPVKALTTAVAPVAPFTPDASSFTASTGPPTTFTVIAAIWQLSGFSVSQI